MRFSLVQKAYNHLSRFAQAFGIAERAVQRGFDDLIKLASAEKADFYIAHHAEALGVAAKAARVNGVGYGFDAEDFHSGMNESGRPSREDKLIEFLEKKYLPYCRYFTAASKGIGEAYSKKYGVPFHTTILNVFPNEPIAVKEAQSPVRLYWYSQVIGPNRSLETLLEAVAALASSCELHLRGSFHSDAYKSKLQAQVEQLSLGGRVFFHPPILAEEIISDAAQFDVGLALESNVSLNRDICVTNKIFSYLMSGLAIVGTDTQGQKDIFLHFPSVVRLCRMNDAKSLAEALRHFIENKNALMTAKKAARAAAETEFNWELESQKLVRSFQTQVAISRKASLQATV